MTRHIHRDSLSVQIKKMATTGLPHESQDSSVHYSFFKECQTWNLLVIDNLNCFMTEDGHIDDLEAWCEERAVAGFNNR